MKNFSLKFIDIMIGVVLGIGFQYWQELHELWQYVAFIYVYIALIDYWIDYGPTLRKFPPKKELDVMLDVAIMFALFLFIFAVQYSIVYILSAFVLLRALDFIWLLKVKRNHHPTGKDLTYVNTWLRVNVIDCIFALSLIGVSWLVPIPSLITLIIFILINSLMRTYASIQYKKVHFA